MRRRLKDITVTAIALTKAPAIRRKFLLLKNEEPIAKPGFEETENEIRYRVRDPKNYKTCRLDVMQKKKPQVFGLYCQRKDNADKWDLQALRFPKEDGWTIEKARKWVKDHPIKKHMILIKRKGGEDMGDKDKETAKTIDGERVDEALVAVNKAVTELTDMLKPDEDETDKDEDKDKSDVEKKSVSISAANKSKIQAAVKMLKEAATALQSLLGDSGGSDTTPGPEDTKKADEGGDKEPEVPVDEINAVSKTVDGLVTADGFKAQLDESFKELTESRK